MGELRNVAQLKEQLLELAEELLLDPDDDLGEWSLRYTDQKGALLLVQPLLSISELRKRAQELRVTAAPRKCM